MFLEARAGRRTRRAMRLIVGQTGFDANRRARALLSQVRFIILRELQFVSDIYENRHIHVILGFEPEERGLSMQF